MLALCFVPCAIDRYYHSFRALEPSWAFFFEKSFSTFIRQRTDRTALAYRGGEFHIAPGCAISDVSDGCLTTTIVASDRIDAVVVLEPQLDDSDLVWLQSAPSSCLASSSLLIAVCVVGLDVANDQMLGIAAARIVAPMHDDVRRLQHAQVGQNPGDAVREPYATADLHATVAFLVAPALPLVAAEQ
jgi:hypothetical protein